MDITPGYLADYLSCRYTSLEATGRNCWDSIGDCHWGPPGGAKWAYFLPGHLHWGDCASSWWRRPNAQRLLRVLRWHFRVCAGPPGGSDQWSPGENCAGYPEGYWAYQRGRHQYAQR